MSHYFIGGSSYGPDESTWPPSDECFCERCEKLLPEYYDAPKCRQWRNDICDCADHTFCDECGDDVEDCECVKETPAERAIIATYGSVPLVYRPEGWKP